VISSAGCGSVTRSTSSVVVNNPSNLLITSNSPVCVGGVIYFNASGIAGTTYTWSGPGSWSATGTGPARSNAQLSMAGTYTNTASIPGCGVVSNTVNVIVTSCREAQEQNPISGRNETGYEGQESVTDANASGAVVSDDLANTTLTIWPNPNAGSSVNLKWEGLSAEDTEITIRVYDAAGKAVYLKTIQKGDRTSFETSIDFWKVLASGMYTVETVQGEKTLYQKMIVR
jgi:hypothetical protein